MNYCSIGFRYDSSLTAFDDKESQVQIEFYCKISWTIKKN